jgi:hypothetical protein
MSQSPIPLLVQHGTEWPGNPFIVSQRRRSHQAGKHLPPLSTAPSPLKLFMRRLQCMISDFCDSDRDDLKRAFRPAAFPDLAPAVSNPFYTELLPGLRPSRQ